MRTDRAARVQDAEDMILARRESHSGNREVAEDSEKSVPDLWVSFFGGFEVLCRGQPLKLGRNGRAIAIFKCLLARRGRPISQDVLMDWLWPESGPKKARWSLNSAVYALRRALDNHPPDIVTSECVAFERGHYRLAQGLRISSDVEEFDARYERGRFLERAEKVEEAASEYERTVALYGGDYLSEDLYEDWTMIERERLTSAYVDILDKLSAYHEKSDNLQQSITDRYLLLEKDPYHEESYQALMRCYAHLGLRGRALKQYELCERRLQCLHGISPAPETRAMREKLLAGENI